MPKLFRCAVHRANQDYEFVEMFKAPIKVLRIHCTTATPGGATTGRKVFPPCGTTQVITAPTLTNPEWVTFRNNKNNEAFLDRVHRQSALLPADLPGRSVTKNCSTTVSWFIPLAHRERWKHCRASLICRAEEELENSSIYSKMRVCDGESLKGYRPKAKSCRICGTPGRQRDGDGHHRRVSRLRSPRL